MLGLVVHNVSGQPYGQYIQKHVLEPLDMRRSFTGKATLIRRQKRLEARSTVVVIDEARRSAAGRASRGVALLASDGGVPCQDLGHGVAGAGERRADRPPPPYPEAPRPGTTPSHASRELREHLVAQGKTNAAMAETLVLTPRAVEKHINVIFSELPLDQQPTVDRRVTAVSLFLAEIA